MTNRLRTGVVLGLVLGLGACGDDDALRDPIDGPGSVDGGGGSDTAGAPDGSGGGNDALAMTVTATVGSAGGTIAVSGATLTIPSGALPSDVSITITRSSDVGPYGIMPSPVYELLPAGQAFTAPVTFTIHLDTLAPSDYRIMWSKDGVSNPSAITDYDLPATTISGNDASASGSHFSEVFGTRLAST